jgi:DNA ligase-1
MMHNENEAFVNERGLTERSSHKSGKVPAGVCGKLICSDIETGDEVRLGSGLNADERVYIWNNRDKLIGKIVKYQHFEYGKDQAPRQPVFLGFRDERDMS